MMATDLCFIVCFCAEVSDSIGLKVEPRQTTVTARIMKKHKKGLTGWWRRDVCI